MRAAVVVILATITGIVALLNFQPGPLDNFGAPASASRGSEVVAIPQAEGDGAQPRIRPEVPSRPSRSVERESPAQSEDQQDNDNTRDDGQQQVKVPEGCRVAINGKLLRVTDENDRVVNLRMPKNGTLTIRCDEDGVRREDGEQDQSDLPDLPDQQQAERPDTPEPGTDPADPAGNGNQDPAANEPVPDNPSDRNDPSDRKSPAKGVPGS